MSSWSSSISDWSKAPILTVAAVVLLVPAAAADGTSTGAVSKRKIFKSDNKYLQFPKKKFMNNLCEYQFTEKWRKMPKRSPILQNNW